jgi:hypothetical protein
MTNLFSCFSLLVGTVLLAFSQPVQSLPTHVIIDTAGVSGTSGSLAFDLIDGGAPANSVAITNFSSNGMLGSTLSTGAVTGTLATGVSLSDGTFFSEHLQVITLGTTISFDFEATSNAPEPGSLPDAFSFFLLDATGTLPLVTTNDPTGADALFVYNIGIANPLEVYGSPSVTVHVDSPAQVPEPATLLLVSTAIVLMGQARRTPARRWF